eukprot:TRINITY_DN14883_c0_g2_i1.p1 TRINITY_DN14883_c0_g2~~TRINITY_DN14883_c0_g2_i1.p1  ORF type:complete len:137 (+),score=24.25 TRINITY_DN14883_c0_g2_i1:115-525(+)
MVRLKNRYILTTIVFERQTSSISSNSLLETLRKSLLENFGDLGYSISLTLNIKYFNSHTQDVCIIRCSRDFVQMVLISMFFITHVGSVSLLLQVKHVSGTLKKCKKAAIEYNRTLIVGVDEDSDSSNKEDEMETVK